MTPRSPCRTPPQLAATPSTSSEKRPPADDVDVDDAGSKWKRIHRYDDCDRMSAGSVAPLPQKRPNSGDVALRPFKICAR